MGDDALAALISCIRACFASYDSRSLDGEVELGRPCAADSARRHWHFICIRVRCRQNLGGPEQWTGLGQNMAVFGITFWPTFWGFMAAFAEFAGGILLMLGFLFRPTLVLLLGTMFVAAVGHISGQIDGGPWHATEMATVFVTLFLTGPGSYSVDAWLFGENETEH